MSTTTENNMGSVTQIIGSTFDAELSGRQPPGDLQRVWRWKSDAQGGVEDQDVTGEVQQHLGGGTRSRGRFG